MDVRPETVMGFRIVAAGTVVHGPGVVPSHYCITDEIRLSAGYRFNGDNDWPEFMPKSSERKAGTATG
jgi:hypothetical protein